MEINKLNEELRKMLEREMEPKTFVDWFGKDLTGQTYNGDIDCSDTKLTSLKGAPKIVNGDFDCGFNRLESLEGSPQEVNGSFRCWHNRLKSLEGGPKKVSGYFDCVENAIETLEGAPQYVGGYFDCSYNRYLTLLKGAPQYIGGSFYCTDTLELKSMDGLGEVKGTLTVQVNGIYRYILKQSLNRNEPKTYEWRVDELEMSEGGFKTAKAAYQDAKKYFKGEGYSVGAFDGEGCTLYDPGDSREGFLEFDGYCEINIEQDEDDED